MLCTLRLHGSKIGVCVPTEIMCNLSMLTSINYIFSESLLNIDSIFGFCFDGTDHNKQRYQILCDHDVGQLCVYLQTLEHLSFYVEFHL